MRREQLYCRFSCRAAPLRVVIGQRITHVYLNTRARTAFETNPRILTLALLLCFARLVMSSASYGGLDGRFGDIGKTVFIRYISALDKPLEDLSVQHLIDRATQFGVGLGYEANQIHIGNRQPARVFNELKKCDPFCCPVVTRRNGPNKVVLYTIIPRTLDRKRLLQELAKGHKRIFDVRTVDGWQTDAMAHRAEKRAQVRYYDYCSFPLYQPIAFTC